MLMLMHFFGSAQQVGGAEEGHRLHPLPAGDQPEAQAGEHGAQDGSSEKQYVLQNVPFSFLLLHSSHALLHFLESEAFIRPWLLP